MLDRVKSLTNIKNDLEMLQSKLPKIKLIPTLDTRNLKNEINKSNKSVKVKVDADTTQAQKKIKDISKKTTSPKITPTVDNAALSKGLDTAGKNTQSFFSKISDSVKNNISAVYLLNQAFHQLSRSARVALEYIKELDTVKSDIQAASGVSNQAVDDMMASYNKMAKQLHVTTQDVAESANEFVRMGESIENTNLLIRNAQMISKLGGSSASDAGQELVTTLKGYNMEAEQSTEVLDKLTATDMATTASLSGLSLAISKTAAIAHSSGVDFDRLLGYVSAIGEIHPNEMASVGNALRSIFSRMNNIKIGKFVDDETGESLSDTEKVLSKLNVKLRDTEDTYRDFDDVFDDVGKKWNNYTRVEQNAIATAVAGNVQREKFLELMTRYSRALEVTEIAANSAGTAEERYATRMDSIEGKTNDLTSALEALGQHTITEDTYKGVLEATTAVVEFTDKTNILKGTFAGLLTLGAALQLP